MELQGGLVVVAPPGVMPEREQFDATSLTTLAALVTALHGHGPQPIGAATLAFTDRVVRRRDARVEAADPGDVEQLRQQTTPDDWEESGLSDMPHRFAAFTPEGHLAAVAGYSPWGSQLAHIGVLADPSRRGHGFGADAAQAAVEAALAANLVAQWRCRTGNVASERLAERLGFTVLGRQLAVALGA